MKSAIVISCLFLVGSTISFAGNENGNGGDGYASEFVLTARTALDLLKKVPPSSIEGVNIDTFSGVIVNTTVLSKDRLFLDGHEVDAINYPAKKLIEISRRRWIDLRSENMTIARFSLVIHEYLGVMGLDDSQYRLSQELVKAISPAKFSTSRWWNPMNPTNMIGFSISTQYATCSSGRWIMDFDLAKSEETLTNEMLCHGYVRKAVVKKTLGTAAQSYGLMGTYHAFDVSVFDETGKSLGHIEYAPKFGNCIITSERLCSQSGEFRIGDVSFSFWMTRY